MGLRQDNKINGAATVRERSVPLKSPKYRSWHTLSPCRVRNLGGVITLQSGAPLTPMSGGPGRACFNDRGIRANVIGGNPEGAKSIDNWFNVGAFEAVPQF